MLRCMITRSATYLFIGYTSGPEGTGWARLFEDEDQSAPAAQRGFLFVRRRL